MYSLVTSNLSTLLMHIFMGTCFVCFLACNIRAANPPSAGPFEVIFQKGGKCPANMIGRNAYTFEDKIVKHSRSYTYMMVNASLAMPVSDDLMSVVRLSVKTSQGWKDNFFTLEAGPSCTAVKTYLPTIYHDVSRAIGIKNCPIPLGNYTNIKISLSNVTIAGLKMMFYNEYRVRTFVKLKNEVVTCLEIYANVIPKKSG